jgi:hypothetical protein
MDIEENLSGKFPVRLSLLRVKDDIRRDEMI